MSLFRALIPKPCSLRRGSAIYSRSLITSLSPQTAQNTKPLRVLFEEAVGVCRKTETDIETETQSNEIKKKLRELEREIRDLKEADPKITVVAETKKTKSLCGVFRGNEIAEKADIKRKQPKSLFGVFTGKEIAEKADIKRKEPKSVFGAFTGKEIAEKVDTKSKRPQRPTILKELSTDTKLFVSHLYNEGYFTKANFFRSGSPDFSCFNDSYGRDFIKFAADKFAKDHQEIAKWLSGSDLKKVALFGCPSLIRKNVLSAKRLRKYFEVQEDTVCSKCVLKHSCQFVNQSVLQKDKTLELAVVMRVIILYALEVAHPELSVPDEIKASVTRLLKEILKLSQSTS